MLSTSVSCEKASAEGMTITAKYNVDLGYSICQVGNSVIYLYVYHIGIVLSCL